jgi:hypothetical protein
MSQVQQPRRRFSRWERILLGLFVFTLPLVNPWVRGDGVGYYAYARSLLIERHLNFEKDWQHGNESFVMGQVGPDGRVLPSEYTSTGHIANIWSIGPSLLWAPFLVVTHAGVLLVDQMGAHVSADGFSAPYLITMAVATSFYGFLSLWISFYLARKYFEERWAFLATLGIWWASSLPVYMYFNPSWSHAHSAFVVALFLWYWHRTRTARTLPQWILLGVLSGLMVNVYYPNGVVLLVPVMEAISSYWKEWNASAHGGPAIPRLFVRHLIYLGTFVVALLPTLISRQIIFGSPTNTGYTPVRGWAWHSPAFWSVLFSSDHGLLSWTPILILALVGLAWFHRVDQRFATYLTVVFVAFYVLISLHPDWDGLSSYGSRFFVSLTPLFVLGLAAFFEWLGRAWHGRRSTAAAWTMVAVPIVWNLGLVYQWGTHLIPARGPISWRAAAYNQVAVVPEQAVSTMKSYLTRRGKLMDRIEREDVKQIKSQRPEGTE